MAYSESKNPLLQPRRRVALPSTPLTPGDPDLHHPLQYRKQEALWKRNLSLTHSKFCACKNFLDHFKWPFAGGGGGDGQGGAAGGVDVATFTGEDLDVTGITGDGEGDISDSELLQ
uniref:ORF2 n=1 Tax=Torque teno Leptonychotes weddellii virus-1 TaxID=2012676 RepID=A0A1Z2RWC2_9VIRU|nr:ORF2 [Torque teno Leptonychotes weddellii virus 1]